MENILISVVVPAYNIEAYIGRCLESILNQEHANLEIIVVNDGSKDNTGTIIDQYAQQDCRIIPIHKENGGVTSARLTGIRRAQGSYIGFVDGDDYIEPQMYSGLLKNAMEYQADISHCGYQMVFPSRIDYYYNTGRLIEQDNFTGLKDLMTGDFVEPGLWNKLYRKELFRDLLQKNLLPESIKINEDVLMNYWLFKESECSIYEDFCPYHYILRKGSAATSRVNEHKLKDPIRVTQIILEDSKNVPEINHIVVKRLATQYIGGLTIESGNQCELIISFQKEIGKELRRLSFQILKNDKISVLFKMKTLWAGYAPLSYRWIHRFYSKITGIDKKYEIK